MKINNSTNSDSESALAGVSALIIFIALVLVSAIAAGVILDTAGFLQEKASTTGTESTSKVSDGLDIVDVVGVTTADPDIKQVRLDVLKAPGAEPINLEDATIKVTNNGGSTTLVSGIRDEAFDSNKTSDPDANASTEFNPAKFSVKDVRDTDNSYPVKNDQTDRFQVRLPFRTDENTANATEALDNIQPGENVDIEITTAAGAQSFTSITIPRTLPQDVNSTLTL